MKRFVTVVCALCMLLSITACTKKPTSTPTVSGKDTEVTTRLENAVELQKNVFVGEILSVGTEKAIVTKYNLDITDYTVYTVKVTDSLDGFTPTDEIKLYCVGTVEQFPTRVSMVKGEKYIIDAEPWVYGDEMIYLLSVYTVAYPRVDISGSVTLETEDGEHLDCGSLENYIANYRTAVSAVETRYQGFSDTGAIASRYVDMFYTVKTKNGDKAFYTNPDMGFDWTPSAEHITRTADNSIKVYDEICRIAELETPTLDDIKSIFTILK